MFPRSAGKPQLNQALLPAAKPWQTSGQSTTSATPYGSSSANDGSPKPWETGTTQTAGDGEAATAGRPWQGATQLAGAPSSALSPYNQNSYGVQSSMYGGQMGGSPMYGRPTGAYGNTYGNSGAYGSTYGNTYGSSMYGSSPYGTGGTYGSGMYGGASSMYGSSPYGGSSMYNNSSMYGGGMGGGMYGGGGLYNRGVGSSMGMYNSSYGSGHSGYGIPNGIGAPGQPMQGPPGAPGDMMQPPRTKWQMTLDSLHGLMTFFGRISMLMDENAHAVHFFITALLQMLDRASFLWGEIARFVLRLLGYRKPLDRGGGVPENGKGASVHMPMGPGATGVPRGSGNDLEGVWKGT